MPDKDVKIKITTDVEMAEVEALESKLKSLESDNVDVDVDVSDEKVDSTKSKVDELDDTQIDVDVNNISAMQSLEQIGQGFDRLKQGASEVGQQMGTLLESSGRMEQTETFLSMNLGAGTAKKKLQEIRSVTDQLPGDDVTLQNLLSQAALKDANMTTEAFTQMGSAAADYMAAMQNFGKTSTETQQDLMNYILAGNTAEIERSPILQAHVDKLKEGTTVQERAKLLQEALTAEGWAGIASQDIYNNKFQQFNDMIERGKMNLGGMFQEGAKGAMDWIMKLDESTNGIVGMGIALAGFASPLTDTVMGLGQMAVGFKALKDLEMIKWLKDLEIMTKLSAAADWLLAGAQAVLNAVMSVNPIVLVVLALVALAAALIWAYYNVDWFREMVDNAFASIVQFGQYIYSLIAPAIQWLANAFQQFTSQLGLNTNDWVQAILGFILFIPTLPIRVGVALANTLARALGFKGNFVQSMISAASSAVTGFVSYITQIPGIVLGEFNRVLGMVNDFINSLPQRVWDMGAAIIDALKASLGIGSPGHMYYMMEGELKRLENLPGDMETDITGNISKLGSGIVDSFNPNLSTMNGAVASGSIGYGNVNNIYISDIVVDNEERVDRLCDAIARRINWNNTTAGRSDKL